MTKYEHPVIAELDRYDQQRTRRERMLISLILIVGLVLAAFIPYEVSGNRRVIRSIACEEGSVTLVIERVNGGIERVECPVEVPVIP